VVRDASPWNLTAVGKLGRIVTGKTPPTKRTEYFGDNYPFITPTDIDQYSRTVETQRSLSEEGRQYLRNYLLPPRAICFVCIGATIGKICMTKTPSFSNQQINTVIADEANHDPRFVYYLLRHNADYIKAIAGGAATPIINKSAFSRVELTVPPFPTQRKIAAILSAYDDLIENNLRRIKILEEMAQLIYQEWFVNFRFPGHENVEMADSELGMIPGNWRLRRLGDMAHFVRGIEPGSKNYLNEPHEGTVPFIRVGDLGSRQSGLFIPQELARGRLLNRHDIAITLDGTVGIVQMGLTGAYSTGIRKVVAQDSGQLSWAYVYFLLKSEHIQGIIRAHARGTTIQHASSAIDHMTFVCPPRDLMQAFDSCASPLLTGVLNIMQRNVILRCTRDLLLPKLISGELDVSELDIDMEGAPQ